MTKRWPWILLIAVIVYGTWIRWEWIDIFLRVDEGHTYLSYIKDPAFGKGDWKFKFYNYWYPNNHIFHTLAISFFNLFLPESVQTVRMPAFLAGVGTIGALGGLGAMIHPIVGLFAALLAAVNPYSIHFSTNARGYTLIGLLAVFTFIFLLRYFRTHQFHHLLLAALFCILGVYTIPTTVVLYFALLPALWYQWRLLNYSKEEGKRLAVFLMVIPAALLFLYAGVMYYLYKTPGAESLHQFSEPATLDVIRQTLYEFWSLSVGIFNISIGGYFSDRAGSVLAILLLLASLFYLIREKRTSWLFLILGTLVIPLLFYVITRKNIYCRNLFFMFPAMWLLLGMGLFAITDAVDRLLHQTSWRPTALVVALVGLQFFGTRSSHFFEDENVKEKTQLLTVIQSIKDHWTPSSKMLYIGPYSRYYVQIKLYMDSVLTEAQENPTSYDTLYAIDYSNYWEKEYQSHMRNAKVIKELGPYKVYRGSPNEGA